jgi:Carboxypeptidase regulatory-like domain/TonB-dependent Receptor Plug Domain/TonB dependent receptor
MRTQKAERYASSNEDFKMAAVSSLTSTWFRLALAIILMLPALSAYGQFESASVLGYARDSSGAAIPNSTVILTNAATGIVQKATTDAEGRYEFASVPIGRYTIATEAPGFERSQTQPFTLTTDSRQRVDLSMKPGSVNETVTVSSAPTVLETETSSRGQVVGTQEIENLPLNGRSYADLALLAPGVRKSFLENQSTTSREASFNVNGQRSAFNNFLLNGLDNNSYGTSNQGFGNENIPPSPDAVSEFRLETDNYSAEYGRASGAVVNASIRRGTNQFHGRAWDYIRNTDLNSIGPFAPSGGIKPTFIRNQFGGTVGGPIWRDHTFFFMDYEGVRQIFKSFATATLPTAEQSSGTFLLHRIDGSSAPIPLQNPITGKLYPNGIIPASDQSALAKLVLAALPVTNTGALPGTPNSFANNFTAFPRGTIQDDKGDARVDHTFNAKLSVFAVYSEHQTTIFDPPPFGGPAGGNANTNVHIYNRQIAFGTTYIITPTSLLDFRMGIGTNQGAKAPYGVGTPGLLAQAGITDGLPTDPLIVRSLNAQAVTGYTQFGTQPASPQFQNPSVINPKANYTLVHGIHSIKLGYEYQAINTQINDYNPSFGQSNYGAGYSTAPGTPTDNGPGNNAAAQISQAHNLADFILGNQNSYSLTNFFIASVRQRMNFMYVQDDIKLMPNLTVNAGLRYELATPQYEANNKLANFNPATNTLIQATNGSIYNRALVNMPLSNVAPRFGFAYSSTPNTVIRSGYGISYTQFNRAGGENNLTYNGPNVVNATINNPTPTTSNLCANDTQSQLTCFRQTQQGFAASLVSPAAFNPALVTSRYIPSNTKTGYIQSYFFGVQQQLPGGFVVDMAYVGNKGTHLQILADYNQAAICAAALAANCPSGTLAARRPVQNFGDIEIAYGGGPSNFNSFQMKVEKRYGNGVYLLNSFTWGRAFDESSGHLETSNGDNSRVNFANPRGDYGRSGYDQPLNNTTSILYDLPYGTGRRYGGNAPYLLKALLGGWQLSTINYMSSGLPVNLNYSLSTSTGTNVTDLYTYRPSISGNPVSPASSRVKTSSALNGYLNKANVFIPLTGSPFGNAQRNMVVSYAFFQTDLGLHKAFPLWREGSSFDFRAEAFNVLNKVNYQAPDSNFTDSAFGSITSAYPARQFQFAAKVIF